MCYWGDDLFIRGFKPHSVAFIFTLCLFPAVLT